MAQPLGVILLPMDTQALVSFDSHYAKVRVRHNDPRDLEDPTSNRQFVVTVFYRDSRTSGDRIIDNFQLAGSVDDVIDLLTSLEVTFIGGAAKVILPVGAMITDVQQFDPEQVRRHLHSNANPIEAYIHEIHSSEVEERVRWWKHKTGYIEPQPLPADQS